MPQRGTIISRTAVLDEPKSRDVHTNDLLGAAFAQSTIPMAVCDGDLAVRFMNAAITLLVEQSLKTDIGIGKLSGYAVLNALGIASADALAKITTGRQWQSVVRSPGCRYGIQRQPIEIIVEPLQVDGSSSGWLITARTHNYAAVRPPSTDRELIAASEKLSVRERQVVLALEEGASNKEIARQLKISSRTVEFHRAKIMKRLDVNSVIGLIRTLVGKGEPIQDEF